MKAIACATARKQRVMAWLGALLAGLALAACSATMKVVPELQREEGVTGFQVKGTVQYDGNREYLPRTIRDRPEADLTFRYEYTVSYGRDDVPTQFLPLINPLTLVGFPIGENTLVVIGKLEVIREGETVKTYGATAATEQVRSLFVEGETFTDLRKKALHAVRDNIELQIYRDSAFFAGLSSADN